MDWDTKLGLSSARIFGDGKLSPGRGGISQRREGRAGEGCGTVLLLGFLDERVESVDSDQLYKTLKSHTNKSYVVKLGLTQTKSHA